MPCIHTVLLMQYYTGTGEVVDLAALAKASQKIQISERSFANLPTKFSMEKYMPTSGDQGQYGTCVAWAVGYGMSTILYAKTHGLTDKNIINKYASSPSFLYQQVKDATDDDCPGAANTINAIVSLTKVGVTTLKTVPYTCFANISNGAKEEALNYIISDASILFAQKGILKDDALVKTSEESVEIVKKGVRGRKPRCNLFFVATEF